LQQTSISLLLQLQLKGMQKKIRKIVKERNKKSKGEKEEGINKTKR